MINAAITKPIIAVGIICVIYALSYIAKALNAPKIDVVENKIKPIRIIVQGLSFFFVEDTLNKEIAIIIATIPKNIFPIFNMPSMKVICTIVFHLFR